MLIIFLLFLLSLAVYFFSFFSVFAFDDVFHLFGNNQLHYYSNASFAEFYQIFLEPIWPGNLYRPIVFASFVLTHKAVGFSPFLYHLTNIALHAGVVIAVFLLLKEIFADEVAIITAILFAIHPIHTEAVANVSYRPELFAAFFGILGTYFVVKKNTKLNLTLSALFIFLAFLSKESSFSFFLLIPLCLFFSRGSLVFLKEHSRYFFLLILAASFYFYLRYTALGNIVSGVSTSGETLFRDNILIDKSIFERILPALILLGRYLALCFFPLRLKADYSFADIDHFQNWDLLLSSVWFLVFFVFLIMTIIWLLRSDSRCFWGLWFFASFVVTANVFLPIGTIFAERLAYLPSLGVCGLLAELILIISNTRLQRIALFIVICLLSFQTVNCSRYWETDETLFSREIKVSPKSAKVHSIYADLLYRNGNIEGAISHYQQALSISPDFHTPYRGLALIHQEQGENNKAVINYSRVLSIKPRDVKTWNRLGNLYLKEKRFEDARKCFERSLQINPKGQNAQKGLMKLKEINPL